MVPSGAALCRMRTSPGEDVLADDAHCRCLFGGWFQQCRERFDVIDAVAAQRLDEQHRQMQDDFERTQAGVIANLALFKTQCLARSARLDSLTGLPLRYGLEEEFKRCHAQT